MSFQTDKVMSSEKEGETSQVCSQEADHALMEPNTVVGGDGHNEDSLAVLNGEVIQKWEEYRGEALFKPVCGLNVGGLFSLLDANLKYVERKVTEGADLLGWKQSYDVVKNSYMYHGSYRNRLCLENLDSWVGVGHGRFGNVWKATLAKTEKDVAIKQMRTSPRNGPSHYKERDLMILLRHKSICNIIGAFMQQDVFLVMELCYGDLRCLLQAIEDDTTRVRFAIQITRGLEWIHAKSIIHNDIRPENVLITTGNNAVLSDFGSAVLLNKGCDAVECIQHLGVGGYQDHEANARMIYSAKNDIFAFAALIFEVETKKMLLQYQQPNVSHEEYANAFLKGRIRRLKDKNIVDGMERVLLSERVAKAKVLGSVLKNLVVDRVQRWTATEILQSAELKKVTELYSMDLANIDNDKTRMVTREVKKCHLHDFKLYDTEQQLTESVGYSGFYYDIKEDYSKLVPLPSKSIGQYNVHSVARFILDNGYGLRFLEALGSDNDQNFQNMLNLLEEEMMKQQITVLPQQGITKVNTSDSRKPGTSKSGFVPARILAGENATVGAAIEQYQPVIFGGDKDSVIVGGEIQLEGNSEQNKAGPVVNIPGQKDHWSPLTQRSPPHPPSSSKEPGPSKEDSSKTSQSIKPVPQPDSGSGGEINNSSLKVLKIPTLSEFKKTLVSIQPTLSPPLPCPTGAMPALFTKKKDSEISPNADKERRRAEPNLSNVALPPTRTSQMPPPTIHKSKSGKYFPMPVPSPLLTSTEQKSQIAVDKHAKPKPGGSLHIQPNDDLLETVKKVIRDVEEQEAKQQKLKEQGMEIAGKSDSLTAAENKPSTPPLTNTKSGKTASAKFGESNVVGVDSKESSKKGRKRLAQTECEAQPPTKKKNSETSRKRTNLSCKKARNRTQKTSETGKEDKGGGNFGIEKIDETKAVAPTKRSKRLRISSDSAEDYRNDNEEADAKKNKGLPSKHVKSKHERNKNKRYRRKKKEEEDEIKGKKQSVEEQDDTEEREGVEEKKEEEVEDSEHDEEDDGSKRMESKKTMEIINYMCKHCNKFSSLSKDEVKEHQRNCKQNPKNMSKQGQLKHGVKTGKSKANK